MAEKKISWKSKRCPKCGSPVDIAETCVSCGRKWTPELEKGEPAIGLEEGQQFESVKRKKSKYARSAEELDGKKFRSLTEELPPQFALWAIKESDPEEEIIRKRSLMRLDSRKIYNLAGLSVRAQETAKAALLWFVKLWDFLDDDEKEGLSPALRALKIAFETLTIVRQAKITQAAKMEKAMEKARQQARRARVRISETVAKNASKIPAPESDSEGLGLQPVALDPDTLLAQAAENLLKLEKAREQAKEKRRRNAEAPRNSK